MASDLMTKASIYGSDSEQYGGSKSETVIAAASGGQMGKDEPPNNPVKAILLLVGLLIGIRVLWDAAKEVT